MPFEVDPSIALFADDAYLYRPIYSNKDTEQLVTWEAKWSMQFHPDKCQILRITNKRNIINGNYFIHNKKLKHVDKAKYLGVTLSSKLSWKEHVASATTKATNARLFLQHNLPCANKETRLKCYKTFVRPIIEYACTVWDPVENLSLINKIEMVQRKSVRWICNDWRYETSPTSLRRSLHLDTLEGRRSRTKLKMLFDIMSNSKQVKPDIRPTRQRCSTIR